MDGPRLQPRPVLVAQAAHGPGENHPKRSPWNWTMRGKWCEWGFPEMVPSSPIAGSYEKKRWFRGTPILRNLQMRENGSVNMFFTAQKRGWSDSTLGTVKLESGAMAITITQFQMGAIGHRFLMPLAVSQPANEHIWYAQLARPFYQKDIIDFDRLWWWYLALTWLGLTNFGLK